MIVWLASYPRSGNRLTRTLLYKTMGLKSWSDEDPYFETDFGQHCGWEKFYRNATESKKVYIVKTHRPPRDSQPAIYLLRDGRKACLSYSYFHQSNTPPPYPSLLEIVMGNDFYGSWSDHYKTWQDRGNLSILRFEELVNASDDLLNKIAEMVRYDGEISSWINPFEEEKIKAPNLVREGKIHWEGDLAWTKIINGLFFKFHGHLMVELGYANPQLVKNSIRDIPSQWHEFIEAYERLLVEKKSLQTICDERQTVISNLNLASCVRAMFREKLIKLGN